MAGAGTALAADLTSDENRGKVMGIIGVSIGMSFLLALILALFASCAPLAAETALAAPPPAKTPAPIYKPSGMVAAANPAAVVTQGIPRRTAAVRIS